MPVLATALALLGPAAATAQSATASLGLDQSQALQASQSVLGQRVGDHTLFDREGRPVSLAAYRGRPLLVSFIYTGCFQVCPTSTRSLAEAVRTLQGRFGTQRFAIVSIGFNQPADSPQALKAYAAQHRIDLPDWEFLSPPAPVVEPLAREFGFRYQATPAGFDHVLQLTLVDAEGRIARQVYGDRVTAEALAEPLQQLMDRTPLPPPSRLAELVERVRLLCTVYDPRTGSYRVNYSLPLEVAGGLTFIVAMLLYLFNDWRDRRALRRRRALLG